MHLFSWRHELVEQFGPIAPDNKFKVIGRPHQIAGEQELMHSIKVLAVQQDALIAKRYFGHTVLLSEEITQRS
jgi:hypothetical protein